ncbi:peroxiredoxin 3 [Phyllostomus discolor]|uniref:Thioredoxin-dependent peroxide reductase, mitochondrial n=1 Tax=Phyllostomus discolor TaxID=89673 RepID=A0A834A9Z5_9CHIR|nr:peroxiredoxin 3 [Phyllostomus discolor]
MAATVGRLLRATAARHVSAISAPAVLRPAASRRTGLTSVSWSASSQAKFAFSTSSAYHAPAVTQHAPYFKGTAVVKGEFKELSLDDFKGKYLVLFFYPLDFTFVCPTEIVAFSDKANEFRDANCEVVAVSVDSHFTHLAWTNTPRKSGGLGHMNIALLSDLTKQISRDYGVLLEGPGLALRTGGGEEPSLACTIRLSFWSLWALLRPSSVSAPAPWTPAWLTSRSTPRDLGASKPNIRGPGPGREKHLPTLGLFIIDPNGVIKHLSVNDLPVGRSVEETLRLVKAFQFVETHGEVCPANWTPDSPTIKPHPTASKEYFEKVNK